MITIENSFLKLQFSEIGAELKSIHHKKLQKELLYDGLGSFWNRSSPILFPIVGRLNNNQFQYEGRVYSMNQHGFARDMKFDAVLISKNEIEFILHSTIETKKKYPFEFELNIKYKLTETKIEVAYKVSNPDKKELLFSIGAHPGFVCPLFENEAFEDYYLMFEKEEILLRHLLDTNTGLFNQFTELVTNGKQKLNLKYSNFEKDAIVFKGLKSDKLILKNKDGNYQLTFQFSDFPYLGIWTKPNAPFICIEPWCGLADLQEFNEEFSFKEGIIKLKANETFKRNYSMEFEVLI
jgi:galactose mutarotase-like enzyme